MSAATESERKPSRSMLVEREPIIMVFPIVLRKSAW
jgi:hypothetical protein